MITAARLADALTPAFVEVVEAGALRPALGMEVVEPQTTTPLDRGDLVVAIGFRDLDEVLALVQSARSAAGLMIRRTWAQQPPVRAACREHELPLLAVAEAAGWSSVLRLTRRTLDAEATAIPEHGPVDHLHSDLFGLADAMRAILAAPVTIEDPTSRVLAYSTGQEDVDEARMSTIFGRQVPREVRDRLRSLGVFRRLARSAEPFLVPAGEGLVKARYVVPVRAGGEWLGSVWAVVDGPVTEAQQRALTAAAELVALHLLRLRAQGELHRQVQLDQVRLALRGENPEQLRGLETGPWRVGVLLGPVPGLVAQARCELWSALARRYGWRHPLVADLDDTVYAVLAVTGTEVGSWAWLAETVRREWRTSPAARLFGGGPVDRTADLADSRDQADELARLDPDHVDCPVATVEDSWAALVLARALTGLVNRPLLSPLAPLVAHEGGRPGPLTQTLAAVIDHWGEPQRAAASLGVHPNTIRYRLSRISEVCPADLDDPDSAGPSGWRSRPG